ncbi:MAG: type I-U CRISPR-associated protein Csx17, partial [Candidatus Thermoplasmatota archaeon]|nr:type I-U CRISPR-associated protein Csx17 [Candidatus Thermoplasmatota archaeon]
MQNGNITTYDNESSGFHDIELKGCSPVPLAHYLKALGLMRILSGHVGSMVSGYWKDETFHLRSELNQDGLVDFLYYKYMPTPVVSPWNGGSGFSPKDNTIPIERIEESEMDRFNNYRISIDRGREARRLLGVTEKVSKEQKEPMLNICRNIFPDVSLEWLDAAYVLTDNGPRYPPLLGTGGNDGRLDFSNNFMKNI